MTTRQVCVSTRHTMNDQIQEENLFICPLPRQASLGISVNSHSGSNSPCNDKQSLFPNVQLHKQMVIGPFGEGLGNQYQTDLSSFRVLLNGDPASPSINGSWHENWLTFQNQDQDFSLKQLASAHNQPCSIILWCIDWIIPFLIAHLGCFWAYCILLTTSIALSSSGATGYHFDPASYYGITPTLLLMIIHQLHTVCSVMSDSL